MNLPIAYAEEIVAVSCIIVLTIVVSFMAIIWIFYLTSIFF